jgi:NAD(P)-dependent dehydrogenase (short-subunit alcohol dehydrogenase family)
VIVEKAVSELGGIDLLVNNAAHQATFESIEDISDEEWELTFRVNIHAISAPVIIALFPVSLPPAAVALLAMIRLWPHLVGVSRHRLLLARERGLRVLVHGCDHSRKIGTPPTAERQRSSEFARSAGRVLDAKGLGPKGSVLAPADFAYPHSWAGTIFRA